MLGDRFQIRPHSVRLLICDRFFNRGDLGEFMQKTIKITSRCFSVIRFIRLVPVLLISFLISPCFATNAPLHTPAKFSDKATSSLLLDIVNTGSRLVAVGERGHVVYSEDNGINWQQAAVPTNFTLTAVYFPSETMGWAVGHDGIVLHSNDGGKSWIKQLDGISGMALNLAHANDLVIAKKNELAQVQDNRKEELALQLEDLEYARDDFQYAIDENGCCDPLMDLWFKNDREGVVIGAYGQIYVTKDGGNTWIPWWDRIDNPDRLHFNAITQAKGALFIAGEAGILYRSMNGGQTWETLSGPYEGSYFGMIASSTESYVFAFGLGGNVVYSDTLGTTWKHIKTKAGAALSGADVRKDGTVFLVSYSGVILSCMGNNTDFSIQKNLNGWTGVTHVDDGHLVLVGTRGVHRVKFN